MCVRRPRHRATPERERQRDYIGTVSDVVTFPGPSTFGNWVVPNTRVFASGLATVGASSVGQAYVPSASGLTPIPMLVVQPDTRVSGM